MSFTFKSYFVCFTYTCIHWQVRSFFSILRFETRREISDVNWFRLDFRLVFREKSAFFARMHVSSMLYKYENARSENGFDARGKVVSLAPFFVKSIHHCIGCTRVFYTGACIGGGGGGVVCVYYIRGRWRDALPFQRRRAISLFPSIVSLPNSGFLSASCLDTVTLQPFSFGKIVRIYRCSKLLTIRNYLLTSITPLE